MDYYETSQGCRIRVLLTDDELGLPAIDDFCNKFIEWLTVSKECKGRKTRSANRRADQLYEDLMAYKLPPIKLKHSKSPITQFNSVMPQSNDTSIDSDSDSSSSRPVTRSLRPRSRTPAVQNKRQITSPSTPSHQRLRAHMKQPISGGSSNGNKSSNVLKEALNQQHPSVSVTKIRQLLRADSAHKKQQEEMERQERLKIDRKAKDEKAEARKRQLLEERAMKAKEAREQRLRHAAEVRKAREEAITQQKLREEAKKNHAHTLHSTENKNQYAATTQSCNQVEQPVAGTSSAQKEDTDSKPVSKGKVPLLNETFKKPTEDTDNIEIIISDESTADQKDRVQQIASWARAPHIREALIRQYTKPLSSELFKEFKKNIPKLELPVDLEEILGAKSAGTRYLCRTSSAVWSPVHRSMKRTSSMVMTPTNVKQ